MAYLASSLQTFSVLEEILEGWDVPVAAAVQEATVAFCRALPGFQSSSLMDAAFVASGLQQQLSTLLHDLRRSALLALPAQERFLEVVESASRPHASAWLLALPVERLGQTMSVIEFRCRLRYQLFVPIFRPGAPCPQCGLAMDQ